MADREGKRGRPRQKPDLVIADRGYDHDKHRAARPRLLDPLLAPPHSL
jgi:hypothetical protein